MGGSSPRAPSLPRAPASPPPPRAGPVAMGYWTERTIPFYYGLARTFPLADRYFASCLASTYPNRRFLQAGTAAGLIRNVQPTINDRPPPNGTIWDRLNAHGIDWAN